MPRAKKDGKFFNCYLDREILEKLEWYCERTSVPKTSVVEKALSQYLMQFETLTKNNNENTQKSVLEVNAYGLMG